MINGKRVLLRPLEKDDIKRQHDFNQDIELVLQLGMKPHVSPLETARDWYDRCVKEDENLNCFAIEVDGKYIGSCSLTHAGSSYYTGSYLLRISIGDRDYQGKGYGRDAIRLLLNYGFQYFGARRIGLSVNVRNERAKRCYLACGFVEEGRIRKIVWNDGEYTDLVQMGILREEWTAMTV